MQWAVDFAIPLIRLILLVEVTEFSTAANATLSYLSSFEDFLEEITDLFIVTYSSRSRTKRLKIDQSFCYASQIQVSVFHKRSF